MLFYSRFLSMTLFPEKSLIYFLQAELFAILYALDWSIQHINSRVYIYSDSLSGLQIIHAPRTHNSLILQIKLKLKQILYKVNLSHVSTHKGLHGNAYRDLLVMQATTNTIVDQHIPISHSFIKSVLKATILS